MTANATIDQEVKRRIAAIQQREHDALVAQLRTEAEAELAAERAENEHQARIAQLRTDIAEQLDPAPVDAAEAELTAALERYMDVCVAHDRRFSDLWIQTSNLAASGDVPQDMSAGYRGTISMGGTDWRKSRLHTRLIRAARAALEKAGPLDHVDLSKNPQD